MTPGHLLFKEMRVTATLLESGCSEIEARQRIINGNLFQYPTEKGLTRVADKCLKCFRLLDNRELISRISSESSESTRQMCMYAMMKYYRLVWDFMISVIGDKYRRQDTVFGQGDINEFFTRLQEQDDAAAAWKADTILKYKAILKKGLVDAGYLDSPDSERLNYILIDPALERAIIANGDSIALPAFNCIGG